MEKLLLRSALALLPATALFVGALLLLLGNRVLHSFLQAAGSGFLVLVVLAHIFEALHMFPSMGWGLEGTVGHYLDLVSAICAGTLFPLGYLLQHLKKTSG